MNSLPHTPSPTFQLYRKRLLTGVVACLAGILFLTGYTLFTDWQNALKSLELTGANLSRAVEISIDGIFDKIDVALTAVQYEAERELASGGISPATINDCIARQRNALPEIDSLRMTNRKGDFLYGIDRANTSVVNVADRDYFAALRNAPRQTPYISRPLFGRVGNRWIIVIARRLNNPDGSFAGVVQGNIPLDFFIKHFASFTLDKGGAITLRDGELGLLVRYPASPLFKIGDKTSTEFTALVKRGLTSATYTNGGTGDSVKRVCSYSKLARYPLYINVGVPVSSLREAWLANAVRISALATLLAVALVLFARFIIRSWEQSQRETEELSRYRDQLASQVNERTAELEKNNRTLAEEVAVRRRFEVAMADQTSILFDQIEERQKVQDELLLKQEQLAELNSGLEQRVTDEVSKNREKDRLMLQQDKLASIGQLAAGVAHEINNPMGFIMSNLGTLKNYVTSINEYVQHLERVVSDTEQPETWALRDRLDMPFVLEDLAPLVMESLEGGERVKRIVLDLKDFARADESSQRETDLNDCIRSTANIVRNEIKYVADLELQLEEIPLLVCNSQQINQVIANLLVNAAHAITEHGTITVATYCKDDLIHLSVTDSGCGIPTEVVNRIFDPFFTTKPVGQGTGLGLSISYDIIKKHGGEILVCSEPGVGTTFMVMLPIGGSMEKLA